MALSKEKYQRIVTAKIFIDDHFHDQIDLDMIARRAFMSPYHFHRLFRQVYKLTPHRYITQKRIEKARKLLLEYKTVNEVCREVGYESPGSFSLLFKKELGYGPRKFRYIMNKKKQEQAADPQRAMPGCFYSQLFAVKKMAK